MRTGGRTPEELESLLEDAFVTRDADALRAMFEDGGVLVAGDEPREARGSGEIARLAETLWARDRTYVAEPRRVVQVRGTALVLGRGGIAVARRGHDGDWRYAIALLSRTDDDTTPEEER
jgi:Domain of unknown function (DUF4440)